VEKAKVKIEIYEGDPFKGCCGPGISSVATVEGLRKMLMEGNETVKTLREEFKEEKVEIMREIVSSRRRYDMYSPHVCKLLMAGTRVPFIVINGQLVLEGVFPSLNDFRQLISEHIKSLHQGVSEQ